MHFTITEPAKLVRQPVKGDLVAAITAEHDLMMFKVTEPVRKASGYVMARAANFPEADSQRIDYVIEP